MADDRAICGTCKWSWKEYGYWCCRNKYSENYDKNIDYDYSCNKHDFREKSYSVGMAIPGRRNVPKL